MDEKDGLKDERLDSIDQLFERIRSSERFEVLGSVAISSLAPSLQAIPELATATLQDLISLGSETFLALCEDRTEIINNTTNILTNFFSDVLEHSALEPPASDVREKSKVITLKNPKTRRPRALAGIESIEATEQLLALVSKFKALPNLQHIEQHSIEPFWDKDWPPAPFERNLRIKQVLSLDIYSFIRKRSMSAQKNAAFITALERAYSHFTTKDEQPPEATTTGTGSLNHAHESLWNTDSLSGISSHCLALLKFYDSQAHQSFAEPSTLSSLLRRIPETIGAREFLTLWLTNDLAAPSIADLLAMSTKETLSAKRSAQVKMKAMLAEEFPVLHALWEIGLRGSGTSIEALTTTFRVATVDADFQSGIFSLLLTSLGGMPLQIKGVKIADHWNSDQRFVDTTFELLWESLPKSDQKIKQALRTLFATIPIKELVAAFGSGARIEQRKKIWHRKK